MKQDCQMISISKTMEKRYEVLYLVFNKASFDKYDQRDKL